MVSGFDVSAEEMTAAEGTSAVAEMNAAVKDKKIMTVMYMEADGQNVGMGIFRDEKNVTMLDPAYKTKIVTPVTAIEDLSLGIDDLTVLFPRFNVGDIEKGKIFRFRSNDKSYVYEEFEDDCGKLGILFNSKNRPIVMLDQTGTYCVNVTYSPKDFLFKVSSGYAAVEYDYD